MFMLIEIGIEECPLLSIECRLMHFALIFNASGKKLGI